MRFLLGCAMILMLSACAGTQSVRSVTSPVVNDQRFKPVSDLDGKGWWFARFRMDWPKASDPNWYMDTLLAHRVIAPVLENHRERLDLWRFHRRAARDGAGHRFSFIFFSKPAIADQIFNDLKQNTLLISLQDSGKIEKVSFDDTQKISRPLLSDTSDRSWPDEIQKTWPSFIMGASQMWLELIHEIAAEDADEVSTTIEQEYQEIQKTLTNLWAENGQHVFFHHLSGIYSYQPMQVIQRKPMRF